MRECMVQCAGPLHYSVCICLLMGNGLCVILNDVANWRIAEAQDILNLCGKTS